MDREKLEKDWEEQTEGKDNGGEDVKGTGDNEAALLLLEKDIF